MKRIAVERFIETIGKWETVIRFNQVRSLQVTVMLQEHETFIIMLGLLYRVTRTYSIYAAKSLSCSVSSFSQALDLKRKRGKVVL